PEGHCQASPDEGKSSTRGQVGKNVGLLRPADFRAFSGRYYRRGARSTGEGARWDDNTRGDSLPERTEEEEVTYRVIWLREALGDVNSLLDRTTDHEAVFNAMDEVDRTLSRNPFRKGESRDRRTRRIFFVPPIYVLFRVNSRRRTVVI